MESIVSFVGRNLPAVVIVVVILALLTSSIVSVVKKRRKKEADEIAEAEVQKAIRWRIADCFLSHGVQFEWTPDPMRYCHVGVAHSPWAPILVVLRQKFESDKINITLAIPDHPRQSRDRREIFEMISSAVRKDKPLLGDQSAAMLSEIGIGTAVASYVAMLKKYEEVWNGVWVKAGVRDSFDEIDRAHLSRSKEIMQQAERMVAGYFPPEPAEAKTA